MKKNIFDFALGADTLLALCFPAQAQQAKKVPRIGYLGAVSPSANADPHSRHSGRVCASLDISKEKTLSLSGDPPRENSTVCPHLAAELVRLKVDVIITGGSGATRPVHEATNTIPIVMTQDPSDPVD